MRAIIRLLLLLLVFSGILTSDCVSQVAPTPGTQDVEALFYESDVVCACSVRSVEPARVGGGPHEGDRRGIATVRLVQLFKPSTFTGSTFDLEYDGDRISMGETDLMFLKSDGPSVYALADPNLGATPFHKLAVSSGDTGLPKLESSLAVAVDQPNPVDQINAMKLLQGLRQLAPSTISRLTALTDSSDPEIAFAAIAVLLKSGDAARVQLLRNYLLAHPASVTPVSILSIGSELGRVRDDKALPALADLSGSTLLSVRIGALQALRALRNSKAAQAVVGRLDDPNAYVRYLAVMTLAETFNRYGDYAPNMSLFDHNPDFYVGLWKQWWITEGQASVVMHR